MTAPKSFLDSTSFMLGLMGLSTAAAARAYLGIGGGVNILAAPFNADPHFTRDSTAGIQMALDAAGEYGWIICPPGKYLVYGKLYVVTGQCLVGQTGGGQFIGQSTEFNRGTSTETGAIIGRTDPSVNAWNIAIERIRFVGNASTTIGIDWTRISYGAVSYCAVARCDVAVLFDAQSVGQCYFNFFMHNTLGYNRVVNVRLQNGANDNNFIGGVLEGTPRSVECLSQSASNTWTMVGCQGQDAPDDTIIHFYIDAPENKIKDCYCEGSGRTLVASAGTTTTVTLPALAATVNQYVNYTVLFISGTGAGQRATITANTGTVVTFVVVGTAPDATSVVQISRSIGIKCTRNGSFQESGMTWGGHIATAVDVGGSVVASGTATGGALGVPFVSSPLLIDASKSWTVNQFQFYRLLITGGTGTGQIRTINSNTSNALSIHDEWVPAVPVDATSTYQILEPGPYGYIREDLKTTPGTGDPEFKFHWGTWDIENPANGQSNPLRMSLDCALGIENALWDINYNTRTSGLERYNFYGNYRQLQAYIDLKTGDYIHNNSFGHLQIGAGVRLAGGNSSGKLQSFNGGVSWVDSIQVDNTTTAGFTRLLVWDIDTNQLQRVKVGAAGTGPGGAGRALYLA